MEHLVYQQFDIFGDLLFSSLYIKIELQVFTIHLLLLLRQGQLLHLNVLFQFCLF